MSVKFYPPKMPEWLRIINNYDPTLLSKRVSGLLNKYEKQAWTDWYGNIAENIFGEIFDHKEGDNMSDLEKFKEFLEKESKNSARVDIALDILKKYQQDINEEKKINEANEEIDKGIKFMEELKDKCSWFEFKEGSNTCTASEWIGANYYLKDRVGKDYRDD